MAMVVKNNREALNALNTLNKNESAMRSSLQKVSSGMKINSAADDASGYSISEKMRVRIRGLDQATANTQNATSMLRTAEGAVQSTIDIMRNIKEKALNSANDTNTDDDRSIIQKEVDQLVEQIDENASATFNGRPLFDGSNRQADTVEQQIIKALNSEWIQNSLEMIKEAYGVDFTQDSTTVNRMKVNLNYNPSSQQSSALAWVTSTPVGGKTVSLQLDINMTFYSNMDMENVNGVYPGGGAANYLDRTIAHEMTHAVMAANIENFSSLPLYIKEGMAELIHGADDNLSNEINSLDATEYTSLFNNGAGTKAQSPYAGGFALFRYMAYHSGDNGKAALSRFMKVLEEQGAGAIDAAVSGATAGRFASLTDLTNSFLNDFNRYSPMNISFYKKECGIDIANKDIGGIMGWDAGNREWRTTESTVPEGGSTKYWIYPEDAVTVIDGLEVEWPAFEHKIGGWQFHTGTKSNESIHVAINDIHAEALGVKAKDGTNISVATWSDATAAIRQIDKSLNRALSYQTKIGAIISRLEYTASNLTTASENTQSSESVIRDADMAKEMATYTKNNVLTQSAQSMLAQANQNSSSVLSLLQ
ncbi:flagellinolysin [Selenomonas ruminantium]|uniref:flagellinolysin n=1 Tax=Selenomonas ruminantium TaxID=971 RepID=UPI0003FF6AD2|nr:flagellinolysin [Selenomonas ruminantium]